MKPILKTSLQEDKSWWELQPTIDNSLEALSNLLKQIEGQFNDSTTLVRKKRHGSDKEKLSRKGYSYYKQCTDLVKGSVIVNTIDEVVLTALYLSSLSQVAKLEVKTGTPDNPYRGAIHLDIILGELTCEVQVMTSNAWTAKKESNHYYKTNRPQDGAYLWKDIETFSDKDLCTLQK